MRVIVLSALLLSGCAPLNLDLMEHEYGHCDKWGIGKDKVFVAYADAAKVSKVCRSGSGLLLVDACAWNINKGEFCFILMPNPHDNNKIAKRTVEDGT